MKNTKGFTLIELLVVITIIAILATGATALYRTAQQKAGDSTNAANVQTLSGAIEQYSMDQSGAYPAATVGNLTTTLVTNGKYIASVPKGIRGNKILYAAPTASPFSDYILSVKMEASVNNIAANTGLGGTDGGGSVSHYEKFTLTAPITYTGTAPAITAAATATYTMSQDDAA